MIKKKQEFLHWLEFEKGRRPTTIAAYNYELTRFLQYLRASKLNSLDEVTRELIRQYLSGMSNTNQKQARARALSVLRTFFKYLTRENHLKSDPTIGIDSPKIERKVPHYLTESQYLHLLEVIKEYAPPSCLKRDLAIVALFLGTGIRRSELISLDFDDVDLNESTIRTTRKGGDQQFVELGPDVIEFLQTYQEQRGSKPGPFFISRQGRGIHQSTVYYLVKKYLFFAGLKGSPHSLRHTCFTELARRGAPFPVIQAIAGHKRAETTSRYTHTQNSDRKKAVALIKLK